MPSEYVVTKAILDTVRYKIHRGPRAWHVVKVGTGTQEIREGEGWNPRLQSKNKSSRGSGTSSRKSDVFIVARKWSNDHGAKGDTGTES